jgi:putative nucleotidyltransferase with HDIG domain
MCAAMPKLLRPVSQCHLTNEAIEEYCFDRLPEHLAAWCRRHTAVCESCRHRVRQNALTIMALKNALLSLNIRGRNEHQFHKADLEAARTRVPVSRLVAARCLATLRNEGASLSEIEAVVSEDPVLAAHLMKVANCALLASRREIRSLPAAILHLGFGRTKVHIWALSAKSLFASPFLRNIWNHSIQTAKVAQNLALASGEVDPEEACLAGLIHDIGQLVLSALGQRYENRFANLRAEGLYPVEIERRLCGLSHAQIGADLLDSWSFPPDIAEAVRQHHTPTHSSLPLTSLLYVAESWVEAPEDIFSPDEHETAMRRLRLDSRDLSRIASQHAPDLDTLRIAA